MTRIPLPIRLCLAACFTLAMLCGGGPAKADMLSGQALVEALRHGGYVLLMRHAHSPDAAPDKATADPGNMALERQLDARGRETATVMGNTIRQLRIPIGAVLSSPTYRARETLRLAGFAAPTTSAELGDGGHSMQPDAVAGQASWLRAKVTEPPAPGSNTLIVTHMPNIALAFAEEASGITDGEALVFKSNPARVPELIAKIKIEEWPDLSR